MISLRESPLLLRGSMCFVALVGFSLAGSVKDVSVSSADDRPTPWNYFDYSSVQFLIATGVLAWIFYLFLVVQKVAGKLCPNALPAALAHGSVKMELFGDLLTAIFAFVGFMAASVAVDEPVQVGTLWYSMATMCKNVEEGTISVEDDSCPVYKIRGSIAMTFFLFCLAVYALNVNYARLRSSGANSGAGAPPGGAAAGTNPMRGTPAAPSPSTPMGMAV